MEQIERASAIVVVAEDGRLAFRLSGAWTVETAEARRREVRALATGDALGGRADIEMDRVTALDTAGAWIIHTLCQRLRAVGAEPRYQNVSPRFAPLIDLVANARPDASQDMHSHPTTMMRLFTATGKGFFVALHKAQALTHFVGLVAVAFAQAWRDPRRLRPVSFVNQLEYTGLRAIPIIGLLSFLIGVVLAYLMSDQLRQFGAELFTVNLIGLAIIREVGVLITAIMIAGRSGSAFTAEIGAMKVNEELDAMRTLGLNPVNVLVVPRVLALMITLPFLVFVSNIAGILGGGVMAILMLDISTAQFVQQLKSAIDLEDFMVGMVKAPVHAYIIAVVGCYEGFRVERSAESVGKQTTASVVESIFLVIVATALFAILFSALGL
ncbi:MAG: ABC transporter permease [Alphaproteobacteria bacterium]|nr:ABC transporter permease [Alphaproteobacteria bacterium]